MTDPDDASVYQASFEDQVTVFVEQHRNLLLAYLDGLTEGEARSKLVASKTTLLGLVKHATFVERVWFGEAATGQTREHLGLVQTPGAYPRNLDTLVDYAAVCSVAARRAS